MKFRPDRSAVVVGAGILGLATAAVLAGRGRRVTVIDPGGANASSVAAGMLAPALESAADDVSPGRAALLTAARDLWPDFASRFGIHLRREGATWRGGHAREIERRLIALKFAAVRRGDEVFTPDDWRLDPIPALERLGAAPGLTRLHGRVGAIAARIDGWSIEGDGFAALQATTVVLAAGWSAGRIELPPPISDLLAPIRPVRGQIERLAGASPLGIVRNEDGYAAPIEGGLLAGATMEEGRTDLGVDPSVARRRLQAARQLTGQPALVLEASAVGIRGSTPDGLPMAGLVERGFALALAPSRNGWLLAPLVAATVADALDGLAPGPWAQALDPARFV